ncbi:MAG TPA: hypothetical protein VIY08_04515 [Candidatus Nitrosocosmicus sp.]
MVKIIDKETTIFGITLFEVQDIVLKILEKFDIIPLVKEDITEIFEDIKK